MKNIKFLKISLLLLGLSGLAKKNKAQTISNHFFGVNAWMPDTIGNYNACPDPPCYRKGKLHNNWGKIKDSKANIIRYGGIAPDKNMPTNYQYIRMIDSMRANGLEPIIQVPYYKGRYTAQQAADIVKYINITKKKKIKYWIIGNEPNLSYGHTTAAQVAAYFKPFASAMKDVDPTILIVGPETASFKKTIIDGLTNPNGADDITGKDSKGRFYLDVFSFHTYPMGNGSEAIPTRDQVISKLTAPGSFQDDLIYLNSRVNAANKAHNRTGATVIKTAVTETNINYTNNASDNLNGLNTNSFIGGQFVAEIYGIGLKQGVDFINLWSVIEGSNSVQDNCGYIDPHTGNKKPVFHHFKMMAENFKGNSVNCTSNQTNVKSFGCQNEQETCVLIMNQDLTKNHDFTVRLNAASISGSDPLKINVNANIAQEYSDVIPNQSSILLVFNPSGRIVRKIEYSLINHASANLPPSTMEFITTDIASKVNAEDGPFDINIFPNPSSGKFTVEINKVNAKEKDIEIILFNMLGQEVYKTKSAFLNKKETIELDES
ncbi:MAG: T9SS type A sorting domain-containing protein, partial [Bacteroidota bacterium]